MLVGTKEISSRLLLLGKTVPLGLPTNATSPAESIATAWLLIDPVEVIVVLVSLAIATTLMTPSYE